MPLHTAIIIGVIIGLAATVLTYLFIMPEGARESLPRFFQILHDVFNFKSLLIEKLIKVLYVFCTLGCIATGIFLLFGSNFWIGLAVIIAGPIVIRVIYELLMLMILLVQNVIAINRKLK